MRQFFESQVHHVAVNGTTLYVRKSGRGDPLLLLHGFPQTHLMWRHIATILHQHFTLICPDLPGYGNSGCPASGTDHYPYSKRAMAKHMISLMDHFGFREFSVVGHDRGGRVAYRMALDFPELVSAVAVLDIIPTFDALRLLNHETSYLYWPWILLGQPEPLPEKVIAAAAGAILDEALTNWGTNADVFDEEMRSAYLKQFTNEENIHAICEEYRAMRTLDFLHDKEDIDRGKKIQCPTLVLWSKGGLLDKSYSNEGGVLEIWKRWAINLKGTAIDGGHFFPEANSPETSSILLDFLDPKRRATAARVIA